MYRYANNPVAAKKLFFQPHRRRRCWFLFFNFFFFAKDKNPSFIYAKNILTTKTNRNALGFFKTCHQGLQVLILILGKYIKDRSWRFSHNSLDDFIFLKNHLFQNSKQKIKLVWIWSQSILKDKIFSKDSLSSDIQMF